MNSVDSKRDKATQNHTFIVEQWLKRKEKEDMPIYATFLDLEMAFDKPKLGEDFQEEALINRFWSEQ